MIKYALAGAAVTLLVAAWVPATRPFQAPDEPSHYLRALTITNGKLLGARVSYPGPLTPVQRAFVNHDTRAVIVPARLAPALVPCIDGKPDILSCTMATPTGDYYPAAYLLPAAALGVSNDALTGLWLARVACALPCIALLLLSIALLFDGDAWSLLGLLAALSPMVFFVCSILNPSGLEVAACLAFAASVLRITRDAEVSPNWVWVSLALSGSVAILAWQVGPGFVLADLALGAALLGGAGLRELGRRSARQLRLSSIPLIAAAIAWLIYSRISGVAHTSLAPTPVFGSLHQGLDQLVPVLRDWVGHFGALTIALPRAARWTWWLLLVAIMAAAIWVGSARERAILASFTLIALTFPVLSYAWFQRTSGFGMQGRYALPMLMLIPLTAGEVIYRRSPEISGRSVAQGMLGATIGSLAGFQAYAWWFDARATSAHGTWNPPLGWAPWAALVALSASMLLTLAAVEAFTLSKHRSDVPRATAS